MTRVGHTTAGKTPPPGCALAAVFAASVGMLAGCGTGVAEPPAHSAASRGATAAAESPRGTVAAGEPRAHVSDDALPGASGPADKAEPPGRVYRPDGGRPRLDRGRLERAGIRRYASRHLELWSDAEPGAGIEALPPLVDALYEALEEYFGPLPPARDGTAFQVTGFVMRDRALFRELDLVPERLPAAHEGWHHGAVFWMNDQEADDYRRHLALHEFTHCFMTVDPRISYPPWYMEGMAELFATHRPAVRTGQDDERRAEFRVLPASRDGFTRWGRIDVIARERRAGNVPSLDGVLQFTVDDFRETRAYAWSWALCAFLHHHPRHGERLRRLGRRPDEVAEQIRQWLQDEGDALRAEWRLFAAGVDYGSDVARTALDWQPGAPLKPGAPVRLEVRAARGWQNSGVVVAEGERVSFQAAGRCRLGPNPGYVSEPQGISIRYVRGRPQGELLALVVPSPIGEDAGWLVPLAIGRGTVQEMPRAGRLFLRVNDADHELADNEGTLEVILEAAGPAP